VETNEHNQLLDRGENTVNKLDKDFQNRFSDNLIFDGTVMGRIDPAAKLHEETLRHPLSSSAACLNVIGSISCDPEELQRFFASFKLDVEELYEFPHGVTFGGRTYHDKGYVVFEWVGPGHSPINELGGGRGHLRTSVDAFVLARVNHKTTQILIEWKFTEGLSSGLALGRFCGGEGIERLSRYSQVLADLRKHHDLPFEFEEEYQPDHLRSEVGLYDLSPDHMYQLLRMTLLAKKTLGMRLGDYALEDYRIVHLTHSQNDQINILHREYLKFSPGLMQFSGQQLHDVWRSLLSTNEKERFVCGHWDKAITILRDDKLRSYLIERYA
jgi:hypothetical protein